MDNNDLEKLTQQVIANPKYQRIYPQLVHRLSQEAIVKGLKGKSAVKHVRNKLHQVAGAYFKQKIDFSKATAKLTNLPKDRTNQEIKDYCRDWMQGHASTLERLPILKDFFQTCLESIAPITSILDLACGLNPLAIPWMPLAPQAHYQACDIYLDMLDLINSFLKHINLSGQAYPCDLVTTNPPPISSSQKKVQLAFLLKSIPCLEQMDKSITPRLLDAIPAEHILVSYPGQSLGGRQKGMKDFYWQHFQELISGTNWQVKAFDFPSELAFLVSK